MRFLHQNFSPLFSPSSHRTSGDGNSRGTQGDLKGTVQTASIVCISPLSHERNISPLPASRCCVNYRHGVSRLSIIVCLSIGIPSRVRRLSTRNSASTRYQRSVQTLRGQVCCIIRVTRRDRNARASPYPLTLSNATSDVLKRYGVTVIFKKHYELSSAVIPC